MKRFWLALGLLAGAIGGAFGQGVSLPVILQPVTSTVPSIDLDFTKGALPSGFVFSRASGRSCMNSSGTLVTLASNAPCFDYNPGTLANLGLSVEAAATNLMFPSGNWQTNATASGSVDGVVQNAATAPDGASTAMALIPGSFSGVHQYFTPFAGTNGLVFTGSVYGKKKGTLFPYLRLTFDNTGFGGGSIGGGCNFTNGTVEYGTATMTALPNGWYRCSITVTSTGGSPWVFNMKPYDAPGNSFAATTGNGVDGLYLWGAQVEQGYAPTSLVATTSSAATRAAEVAYLPVTGVRGVNGNAGTLFAQFIYEAPCPTGGCYSRLIELADGNNVNTGLEIGFNISASYPSTLSLLGNGYANTPTTISAGSSMRAVVAFTTGQNYAAANADAVQSFVGTAGGILRAATVLNLNQAGHYQFASSLWVQRVTYIPAFMGAAWVAGKANGSIP